MFLFSNIREEKGQKGHHSKEDHEAKHEEKKGHKKKHHDDAGWDFYILLIYKEKHRYVLCVWAVCLVVKCRWNRYHEKKEEGKKGEKGHEFKEEGRFHKGHSIKGKHVVHKIDEGEKNTKFFDEDYDGGFDEKHGGFKENHEAKKGGHHKKGHHHKAEHSDSGGKKGHGEKGHHDKEDKGC